MKLVNYWQAENAQGKAAMFPYKRKADAEAALKVYHDAGYYTDYKVVKGVDKMYSCDLK